VIAYVRIKNGTLRKGDKIKFFSTGFEVTADEVGILKMGMEPQPEIGAGNVGYIITGIKISREIKVGDTITTVARPSTEPVKGFEEVKPMVFAGVYPLDNDDCN
jgi:GTP-binding protein LepA